MVEDDKKDASHNGHRRNTHGENDWIGEFRHITRPVGGIVDPLLKGCLHIK